MEEAPPQSQPPDGEPGAAVPAGDELQLPFWQGGENPGRDSILLYEGVVAALRETQPRDPSVLHVLAELRRLRRVMIATPLPGGETFDGPAAIDVLMPSPDGGGCAVRLMGQLSWAEPPADGEDRWTLATVVKTQAHGQLRHLSCIGPEGTTRRVAVRLGLFTPLPAHAAQACLRVRDVTRLWLALGAQWSFRLLLAAQPLALALPSPATDADAAQGGGVGGDGVGDGTADNGQDNPYRP